MNSESRHRILKLFVAYLIAASGGLVAVTLVMSLYVGAATWSCVCCLSWPLIPMGAEVAKPIGVILLMNRWGHWLRGRRHVVVACALAGLVYITVINTFMLRLPFVMTAAGPPEERFLAGGRPWGSLAGEAYPTSVWVLSAVGQIVASSVMGIGLSRSYSGRRRGYLDKKKILPFFAGATVLSMVSEGVVMLMLGGG